MILQDAARRVVGNVLAMATGMFLLCHCASFGASRDTPSAAEIEQLVDGLFHNLNHYAEIVQRLSRRPGESLAALKRRPEPKLLSQKIIYHYIVARLENLSAYQRWDERYSRVAAASEWTPVGRMLTDPFADLSEAKHSYFWAERLLLPRSPLEQRLALAKLEAIGADIALDAVAAVASSPSTDLRVLERTVAILLENQRGEVIIAAIALRLLDRGTHRLGEVETLKRGLVLARAWHQHLEAQAIRWLQRPAANDPVRLACLHVLEVVGGNDSLRAVSGGIKGGNWPEIELQAEIVRVIIAKRLNAAP